MNPNASMSSAMSITDSALTATSSTHPLILTRLYHRWIPRLAKEPTSTLLLITPLNRFLDLRFSRSASQTPLLLHGTAGTYIRTLTSGLRGHTIDTLTNRSENHYHTLCHQLNGDVRESGELIDPCDHVLKEYEAVWRVAEVTPRVCVVLVMKGPGGGRGMVVRVGAWCQGLMKVGGEVTAERWVRGKEAKWERVVRVGREMLPCSVACLDRDEAVDAGAWQGGRYWREAKELGFAVEKTIGEGDSVRMGKWDWEVVERCHW